jgi:hypothetical protein
MMRFLFLTCGLVLIPGSLHCQTTHEECERRIQELERRLARVEGLLARMSSAPPPAATLLSPAEMAAAPNVAPDAPPGHPPAAPFAMPPELVPQIGKIGAEVGLLLSGASSPFRLNSGQFFGGFIDLPLFEPPRLHGKISYEISVGMSQSKTTFPTTSNVAQVANLAVLTALNPNGGLQNVTAAVTGTGAAPFPVTTSSLTRLRLLQVVPFAFKYTSTAFDRWRLRPYGLVGFGTYVTIHSQNPALGNPPTFGLRPDANVPPDIVAALQSLFGGKAPFGGPLVAGQISQAPELEARGLPGGHGNLDFGLQTGGGLEFRVHRNLSVGFDARFNKVAGTYGSYVTYGTRLGFHF